MQTQEDDRMQQILQKLDCHSSVDSGDLMANPQNIICEPAPLDAKEVTDHGVRQTKIKWRNAFSYVYQVRRKLSTQPLIYNEFIDIMRKVHNRCVETTQVVNVITHLFKDHPDLIRGFNTFLPDIHKIETEVKLRVGVSGIPSPDSPSGDPNEREELPITSRIIRFTLNVRKRFEDDEKRPDKYRRFIEVLYLYKSLSQQLQGLTKCRKKLREEDVYAEVKQLFENNEDLLGEFSEYLPYNKKLSEIYGSSYRYKGEEMPVECSCCSEVSSSEQVDIKKEIADRNVSTSVNDEVTSSDCSGAAHSRHSPDVESGLKRKDNPTVTWNHFSVKKEVMDGYLCNNRNPILSQRDNSFLTDIVEQHIEDLNITDRKNESSYNLLNSIMSDVSMDHKVDSKDIEIDEKYFPTIGNQENISSRNKTFNDENDIKSYKGDAEAKSLETDSPKGRSTRKPLKPFKTPNPPSSVKTQHRDTKHLNNRVNNCKNHEPHTSIGKRQSVRRAKSRSPSPPDLDTPVITRLAKRAAQCSPDEETPSGSSPRNAKSSPSSASALPRSSDRRLKNLKKRLRRLVNL